MRLRGSFVWCCAPDLLRSGGLIASTPEWMEEPLQEPTALWTCRDGGAAVWVPMLGGGRLCGMVSLVPGVVVVVRFRLELGVGLVMMDLEVEW